MTPKEVSPYSGQNANYGVFGQALVIREVSQAKLLTSAYTSEETPNNNNKINFFIIILC